MKNRLAVCSWSLQATNAKELVERIQQVGVKYVQLALSPVINNPEAWKDLDVLFKNAGISVISGMAETIGEDYSTLESIRLTGGIVPDAHWEGNWKHFQKIADLAVSMDIKLITFHAGFIPHEPEKGDYKKLRDRIIKIAELFQEKGLILGLETGQERAEHLKCFLESLPVTNVRVNYDPANILLYNNGDPIEVIDILAKHIEQCHLKDATRTKVPGTWGAEVAVGTGEVNWPQFFEHLKKIGFKGDFSLEREAGNQRIADLSAGRCLAEQLMY